MADPFHIQRAAGAVLRSLRRPGTPPEELSRAPRGETLRPALAIAALLAAMRARFELSEEDAAQLLLPALADWRDAVGCADPLFLARNAQEEKQLLPLPLPSWCTALIDAGVLRLAGPPVLDGARVVQQAFLAVVREAELSRVECFPIVCAGRFAPAAASIELHLALSPGLVPQEWVGTVCLRAAAHRREGKPVPIYLGPPADPSRTVPEGASAQTVATWVAKAAPRWAVLRVLEGKEPQALWDLEQLRREPAVSGTANSAPAMLRLAVDLGSTETAVVEEDHAGKGSIGRKLLRPRRLEAPPPQPAQPAQVAQLEDAPPSGFRLLAGDARTAAFYGCGETLLTRGAQLPSMLAAAGPRALLALIAGAPPETLWLQQGDSAGLLLDRFKSPELVVLSDWLARVSDEQGGLDPARVSRKLLDAYAYLLGRTLACAHSAPLVTPEGGRFLQRWPRLGAAEAIVTYPQSAWSTSRGSVSFAEVLAQAGSELCRGLRAAWPKAEPRLVPDPAAARAARSLTEKPDEARLARPRAQPIEAFVDLGGLTLQITVRVPHAEGRPAPLLAGSSMSYLLGGERLIDAAAFAGADLAPGELREEFRANARRWRQLISSGGSVPESRALRPAVLGRVFALVRRQLEGTLRRAGARGLGGAGVRLYLLGQGWKLFALDAPDEVREAEALRRIEECLAAQPLGLPVELRRMTKAGLCEGALLVPAAAAQESSAAELQGVDVGDAAGLRQRWFGVAGLGQGQAPDDEAQPEPGLSALSDGWWRDFAGAEGTSLLRVEQWFASGAFPFRTGLAGGRLAFDARRSVLKQWLDVSGPSLWALRIREALSESPHFPPR